MKKFIISLCLVSSMLVASQQLRDSELSLIKDFGIKAEINNNWIDHLNSKLAQFNYPSTYQPGATNALFTAFPALKEKLPYITLGSFPTPIEKLETLSNELGISVYIKRDDFSGGTDSNGNAIYGGNKVRKLEFLLADAQRHGATKVLTFGCAGSNHAVATAVHADRIGMQTICMLKHQPASAVVQRNLLMHLCCNSQLHFNVNNDVRKLHSLMIWLEEFYKDGHVPYIIPTGGSNILGTIGYVNAIFELAEQIKNGIMPKPTHIYVACGSCATTAGILLGCKAAGLDAQVVAIVIEPGDAATFAQTIDSLFKRTNQYLRELDSTFPELTYDENDLNINLHFAGPGYGVFTQEGASAAETLEKSSGIQLEGTYTAKAFAGMLSTLPKNSDATVLFWNTYCGLPMAELDNKDYRNLPHCFHYYFDEANMQ